MGALTVGHAETYNFFMGNQKAKKAHVAQADADDDDTDEEEKPVTQKKSDSLRMSKNGQPLIINNVNNNTSSIKNIVGGSGRAITKRETNSNGSEEGDAGIAASIEPKKLFPPFRFSLTATGAKASSSDFVYDNGDSVGLLLGLGWAPSRLVEWKAFAGVQQGITHGGTTPYVGTDLEFTPFRIGFADTWDLFRLGFFAGASTLAAAPENIGSFHFGTRATVQLGAGFGVTAGVRANMGYVMFEGGLTASL